MIKISKLLFFSVGVVVVIALGGVYGGRMLAIVGIGLLLLGYFIAKDVGRYKKNHSYLYALKESTKKNIKWWFE